MDQPDKLTVTLRADQAERIRTSVANGEYASADDFVASAIDSYDDLPSWLPDRETLKRELEEALNDPRPHLTSEEVAANIERWAAEAELRLANKDR